MAAGYLRILLSFFLALNFNTLFAQENNQINDELLKKFHKRGITKCDNFIKQHSFIDNSKHYNWYYNLYNIREKNANSTIFVKKTQTLLNKQLLYFFMVKKMIL